MTFRRTQLSTSIYATVLLCSSAFADDSGNNGSSLKEDGTNADIIGKIIYGAASVDVIPGEVANGGDGGDISDVEKVIAEKPMIITGTSGDDGNSSSNAKGGGNGGGGGGSMIGGVSYGGAGGNSTMPVNGGNGGEVSGNTLTLADVTLIGADGGSGGDGLNGKSLGNGAGTGGTGGGSVIGGISYGGVGGYQYSSPSGSIANGGNGGVVSGNKLTLTKVTLTGADGGHGGEALSGDWAGGSGGTGGGSVIGGISYGGSGGGAIMASSSSSSSSFSSGGDGGAVYNNTLTLTDVTLIGANGGHGGGRSSRPDGASGGAGGGSVIGGISYGAAGGYSRASATTDISTSTSNGGNGGSIYGNALTLTHVTLMGADGGHGGVASSGVEGGSVIGGISYGGAGGSAFSSSSSLFSNGGHGGDVSNNKIILNGTSSLSGAIYGGYSHGGAAGSLFFNGKTDSGSVGLGGLAQKNSVTLVGANITIAGGIYGGWSVNGDGVVNEDKAFTSYYKGNTLNLAGYRGSLQGIYNFENYNWLLPRDVVDGDTLIHITGNVAVSLDNTKHSIAMEDDGNRLNAGDLVTLIDKAQGTPTLTTKQIKQGQFLIYEASLAVTNDELLLKIDGNTDTTPGDTPAGEINPTSKAFLEGRTAMASLVTEGADLISDRAIPAARANSLSGGSGLFLVMDGGSSRYSTGSHVDLRGTKVAIGFSQGFTLDDQSTLTAGVFMEHGSGRYDSQNHLDEVGRVKGNGDTRYTGGGVLADLSGLGGKGAVAASGAKEGAYASAALRAGRTHHTFDSNDLVVHGDGARADYNSRSNYFSVMTGGGYILSLDEHQTLDFYGRYTWSSLDATKTNVGNSTLKFDTAQSSRVRVGTRYNYTTSETLTPYVGVAYEHEFRGEAGGSAYGLSIDAPSTKGNTGIVETGITMKPWKDREALSMDVGFQGFFGKRVGALGGLTLKYAF